MSKFIGRRVESAIAIETARGVGLVPQYGLGKIDFSVFDKTVDVRDDSSIGRIEDSNDKFVVEKYAQGSIGGILGANSALYLFALALGTSPTLGATSDSRTSWTVPLANTNQHASASLLVKDANQTLLHKLMMLEKLEITIDMEEAVKFTAEFISKVGRTSTQSIPTYLEDYKFTKRKAKIYLATAIAGLGAATRLSVKSFKLTISKNLVRDSSLGTAEPEDILNQSFSIEGEIKLNWNDQTYKNLMLNGTYNAMRLKLESEKLIGVTSYGDLTLDLSKLDFFSWEPDAKNEDIVLNTVNFKGNYDLSNAMVNALTIRNARSAL